MMRKLFLWEHIILTVDFSDKKEIPVLPQCFWWQILYVVYDDFSLMSRCSIPWCRVSLCDKHFSEVSEAHNPQTASTDSMFINAWLQTGPLWRCTFVVECLWLWSLFSAVLKTFGLICILFVVPCQYASCWFFVTEECNLLRISCLFLMRTLL